MANPHSVIETPEVGEIVIDDDTYMIRTAARDVLPFGFNNRRRICRLGFDKNEHEKTVSEITDQHPLIWVPVDEPILRAIDFPDNNKVIFERRVTDWSGRGRGVSIVGPWAFYDDCLYVLTLASPNRIVIRKDSGPKTNGKFEKVWSGIYGLSTSCRIDDHPDVLFPTGTKGIEIFTVSCGREFPVYSKRDVFSNLRNAQVLKPEPLLEEQRSTKTGRRSA